MRMWAADPKLMCRNHLLGEHRELHALVGLIRAKKSLEGYIKSGLVCVQQINQRHDDLHAEMLARWGTPFSKLPEFEAFETPEINVQASIAELLRRCPACKNLHEHAGNQDPTPAGGNDAGSQSES